MRLSLNWLKDYVDIEMPPHELGELLTMIGLEVEEIKPLGQSLEDVVVAKISVVEPHPEADNLFLCQVDTGRGLAPVVCSAPNLEVGAVVPLALPGATLPGGASIRESRLRGEISKGMLLAEDELGLTDDHSGIMVLPSDLAPGTPLSSALPLSDWSLDIDLTPNRPDCASVMGIAREIAAATGKRLKGPEIEIKERGPAIEELTSVSVMDTEGCPRYAAGIIQNVELGPSPFWLRYRLFQSGIRSINNIVDVTNYVLLEMGQPLHAFDYHRLRENRILVRRAQEGEIFTTLDGESRKMSNETLMICDGERFVALAGIMGGINSEIFAGTRDALVESAFFDPVTIRRSSKHLGLSTEASYRFERGVDIGGAVNALRRAISLIHDLAGGTVARGLIDNYPRAHKPPVIDLNVDRTNRFLGATLSRDAMGGYLRALEMDVEEVNEDQLRVKPPSFRVDIAREADLMEEVARLSGYDNIPITYPNIRPSEEGDAAELVLSEQVRPILVGLGFSEIITYSFISPDSIDALGAEEKSPLRSFVRILNPLTIDQSIMRTSLIPGLMATVRTNILHDERALRLFEWGKVFIRTEDAQLPLEKIFVGAVMTGPFDQKTWCTDKRNADFYDIKGSVEALFDDLGFDDISFRKQDSFPGYDEEVSSGMYFNDTLVGQVGRVSPKVVEAYELDRQEVYLFELDMEALLKSDPGTRKFRSLARFPAVYRDISIVVAREIESASIEEVIRHTGGDLLESVHIFDLYEGKGIGPSEKALAFRICYRSEKGTLDGEEVNRLHESVIDAIGQETGGKLREG